MSECCKCGTHDDDCVGADLRARLTAAEQRAESAGRVILALVNAADPWLAEAAEALGEVRPEDSAPLALNWTQVIEAIHELREDRDALRARLEAAEKRAEASNESRVAANVEWLAIVADLRADVARLTAELAEAMAALARTEWEDGPQPEDEAIHAAHPTRCGNHEAYAKAMRLVGSRRSKGSLVSLVTWLLAERDVARAELERWRHGVQVEGDYVCPDSVALTAARAEVARLQGWFEREHVEDAATRGQLRGEVGRLRAVLEDGVRLAATEEMCNRPCARFWAARARAALETPAGGEGLVRGEGKK